VLYPAQDLILSLCSEYKYLYLTGGTALARFYLNHRLSEDLDFFIQVLDEDTEEVIEQQKKTEHYADDLAGKISRYFPVFGRSSGDLYSKFYVKLEGFDLKIDVYENTTT